MFSNHELEDVGMVFSQYFHKLGIPTLIMVGNFLIITKLCLHKVLVKMITGICGNSSVGHTYIKAVHTSMDISWMEMK